MDQFGLVSQPLISMARIFFLGVEGTIRHLRWRLIRSRIMNILTVNTLIPAQQHLLPLPPQLLMLNHTAIDTGILVFISMTLLVVVVVAEEMLLNLEMKMIWKVLKLMSMFKFL